MRLVSLGLTLAVGFLGGRAWTAQTRPSDPAVERVTGIGGVFLKSKDPKALGAWYRDHLGIAGRDGAAGFTAFEWRERQEPSRVGSTAWALFRQDTKYFAPSQAPFMINYRVRSLDRMIAQFRAHGIAVEDKIGEEAHGRFACLMDPDGNRVELWEPKEGH